ncbi:MAG: hypothetical protein Q8903_14815 [Bacteroidota bacterium]|nr:hypothetical protein [Bacteroidota bacterium]
MALYIGQMLIFLIIVVLVIMYIPDLIPRCACCRHIKPRFAFRVHKLTGVAPGYRGNTSICKKCCRHYNISTIEELRTLNKLKKRIESGLY